MTVSSEDMDFNYTDYLDNSSDGDNLFEVHIPATPAIEIISCAMYISIFVFSLIGNVLVLGVLLFGEKLKNVPSVFVLNLACSDLVFTLTLPFWAYYHLHHWVFGEYACKILTAAYIVGVYSSVILLTAITVDRFVTVVLQWPNNPTRRKRFVGVSCAAAWIISIAASVNDAINVEVVEQWGDLLSCHDTSQDSEVYLGYYLQVSLLFFLPFAIIVFCYSVIIKTILQASNRRIHRPVIMILCIVAVFFICWGPYNIILIIRIFYHPKNDDAEERLYNAYLVCRIIAYSHCCMNPLLYMIPQTFRKHVWKVLCCKKSKKERDAAVGQSTTCLHNVAFTAQNSAVIL